MYFRFTYTSQHLVDTVMILFKAIPVLLLLVHHTLCSFYEFREQDSTVLHDMGIIDSYLFPISGVPEEVLRAANSSDPYITAFATSVLQAALYFRTHPSLLSSLTLAVVTRGRQKMRAAQRAAYDQLIAAVGADSHLGQLLSDYGKMMTGSVDFSAYIKDALVKELERQLRAPGLQTQFKDKFKSIELEYERRMMDVMLEGTADSQELQTPFWMMAAGMKAIHDRVEGAVKDKVPEGTSPHGSKLNATMPHNEVEFKVAEDVKASSAGTGWKQSGNGQVTSGQPMSMNGGQPKNTKNNNIFPQ